MIQSGALANERREWESWFWEFGEVCEMTYQAYHDGSLGDYLLTPACPKEKATLWAQSRQSSLWEGLLYLTSGSKTDEGLSKDKVFAWTGNPVQSSVR